MKNKNKQKNRRKKNEQRRKIKRGGDVLRLALKRRSHPSRVT
jgi:hypothetical protein